MKDNKAKSIVKDIDQSPCHLVADAREDAKQKSGQNNNEKVHEPTAFAAEPFGVWIGKEGEVRRGTRNTGKVIDTIDTFHYFHSCNE